MKDITDGHLIYSTDKGAICPQMSGKVRIRHETAGRKNKGVTIIYDLHLSPEQLEKLAKKLKSTFGTGGAVKDYTIELQGDQRGRAAVELCRLGYSV